MNERIKELAKQAQDNGDAIHYYDPVFAQKFAELIVRECAGVVLNTEVEYIEIDAMHRIRDNIKEHFGVE
jgi:hypothetical protein